MSQIPVIAVGSILWFAVVATALSFVNAGLAQDLLPLIPVTLLVVLAFRIRNLRRNGRIHASSVGSSQQGQTVLG